MGIKEWKGAGPLSRSSRFHTEWKAFNLSLWNSVPSFIRILKILYLERESLSIWSAMRVTHANSFFKPSLGKCDQIQLPHMFLQNTQTLKLRSSNSCNKLFNHKSIKSKTKWDLTFPQRWWQKIQVFWDMTPCQLLTVTILLNILEELADSTLRA